MRWAASVAMSRAVVIWSSLGRPEALRKVVAFMPMLRAVSVITLAKFSSVPARFSAMVTAASLADCVMSAFTASLVLIVAPGLSPSWVGAWLWACGVTTSSEVGVILPARK